MTQKKKKKEIRKKYLEGSMFEAEEIELDYLLCPDCENV